MQVCLTKWQKLCDEVTEIGLLLEVEGFKVLEEKGSVNKTCLISYLKYCGMKYFHDFKIKTHISCSVTSFPKIVLFMR
jgi:hypothetical protein